MQPTDPSPPPQILYLSFQGAAFQEEACPVPSLGASQEEAYHLDVATHTQKKKFMIDNFYLTPGGGFIPGGCPGLGGPPEGGRLYVWGAAAARMNR